MKDFLHYENDIYEVQLGRIKDGAKNGDLDYDSPQIILIKADHYISIEEVEKLFNDEIQSLNCDCVYGITPIEKWEFEEYECYQTCPKYEM